MKKIMFLFLCLIILSVPISLYSQNIDNSFNDELIKFKNNSEMKQLIIERWLCFLRPYGMKKLNHLRTESLKGSKYLNNSLKDYSWTDEKFNSATLSTWFTCIIEKGDCDDSAWLLSDIRNGKIYCVVDEDKLDVSKNNGHFFFIDDKGNVWSNFKLDYHSYNYISIKHLAYKYLHSWTHVAEISNDIKIIKIIKR